MIFRTIARANNFCAEWEDIMPGHRSFLRYNYKPKLEKAWTFGEDDDTPLRPCINKVYSIRPVVSYFNGVVRSAE